MQHRHVCVAALALLGFAEAIVEETTYEPTYEPTNGPTKKPMKHSTNLCTTGRDGADNTHEEVCKRRYEPPGTAFPTNKLRVAFKHVCYPVDEKTNPGTGCPSDMRRIKPDWVWPVYPSCKCDLYRTKNMEKGVRMCVKKQEARADGEQSICVAKSSTYDDVTQKDSASPGFLEADTWFGCPGDHIPCVDLPGGEYGGPTEDPTGEPISIDPADLQWFSWTVGKGKGKGKESLGWWETPKTYKGSKSGFVGTKPPVTGTPTPTPTGNIRNRKLDAAAATHEGEDSWAV